MSSRLGRVALLAMLLSLFGAAAAEAAVVEVTASALNIRSGPSTSSPAIGVASRGDRLNSSGQSGSWVQVSFRGQQGWAHGGYLRQVGSSGGGSASSGGGAGAGTSGSAQTVTASALNVRSGPGTSYRAIGLLRNGDRVRVVSSSGDWRQIAYGGGTAWVHGAYLGSGSGTSGGGSGSTSGGGGGSSSGTSSSGTSRAGFIQMPSSGPGYFGYYASSKRWGTPRLVYGLQRAARRFVQQNPGAPRMGVGDISLMNGGPIAGHASHQRGVDADVRPVRNDGGEGPVTIFQSAYSRSLTQSLLQIVESELSVTLIFFNDTRIRGVPHRQNWPNHDNHFHVRIR